MSDTAVFSDIRGALNDQGNLFVVWNRLGAPVLAVNGVGAANAAWLEGNQLVATPCSIESGAWTSRVALTDARFDTRAPTVALMPDGVLVVISAEDQGLHALTTRLSP